MSFKFRSLAVAVAAISSAVAANAAGLDRSTQPSSGFTQDGTFAYIEHVTINPSVEGKDASGNAVPNMAEDYNFLNFGAKADVNDTISVGAFFDQPWGADARYSGNNNFVDPTVTPLQVQQAASLAQQAALAARAAGALAQTSPTPQNLQNAKVALDNAKAAAAAATIAGNILARGPEATNVNVTSQNFTGLVGVKLGDKKQFQIYGGPTLQRLEGDVHLRGSAYGPASGYDASISEDTAYGWMAGVAYSKPEIALKAALTYRSEIDHDTHVAENMPIAPLLNQPRTSNSKLTITTPKSVNLDFQTGLNPTTLLTAKVRWVPWSDFAIKPKLYNQVAIAGGRGDLNLVDYQDDAWTAEVGLGKKLSDKLALSGVVGWDSGAGNPVTSLGPVEGNWNVGLGARYNITPEWAISGGVKYLMFGDAKAQLPDHKTIVGDFQDNDGMVYGLRLSYQKK